MIFMTLLFKLLAGDAGNLGVLHRHDLVNDLDHCNINAHRVVKAGEFNADSARPDDQQRFGHFRRHHGLEIGPDQFPIRLQARQHTRTRACRHDDVFRLVGALTCGILGRGVLRLHCLFRRLGNDDLAGLRYFASPQITCTLFFLSR
jgi:hypothetical protein